MHIARGYLCAVASASFTWMLLAFAADVVRHGFIRSMTEVIVMGVALFLVIGLFAAVTTAIPVFLVDRIAKRFSVRSAWYFAGCGALTGLALSPVAVLIQPRMFFDMPPDPPLIEQSLNIARYMIPSGAVGGLAYWWGAIRACDRIVSGSSPEQA